MSFLPDPPLFNRQNGSSLKDDVVSDIDYYYNYIVKNNKFPDEFDRVLDHLESIVKNNSLISNSPEKERLINSKKKKLYLMKHQYLNGRNSIATLPHLFKLSMQYNDSVELSLSDCMQDISDQMKRSDKLENNVLKLVNAIYEMQKKMSKLQNDVQELRQEIYELRYKEYDV